jgi:hypothetical protein
MSANYSIASDLREAETMVDGLSDYVRGDDLYGQTGGMFSNSPSLTVGALLMRLRRLDDLRAEMSDAQRKKLDALRNQHQSVRDDWAMHYEQKLIREAKSRIDAMRRFFEECADSIKLCANVYNPEMLRRTIVQEIQREMQSLGIEDSETETKIKQADGRLRGYLSSAGFQWAEMLEPVYPESEFWWLYQRPQPDEE